MFTFSTFITLVCCAHFSNHLNQYTYFKIVFYSDVADYAKMALGILLLLKMSFQSALFMVTETTLVEINVLLL